MAATTGRKSDEETILLDVPAGGIALITLNRPAVRNALDLDMLARFHRFLVACESDDSVRVIVLTGSGSCFCSGDDLRAAHVGNAEDFAQTIDALQRLSITMLGLSKPIIAALNGPAFGAGLELTLACDLRIATPEFYCAMPEVRLGLIGTNGASVLLPLLVGQSRARRMMLGGGGHDAPWCLEAGLIDEIVPREDLLSRGQELASDMMKGSPGAVAATRHMLSVPIAKLVEEAIRLEAQLCKAAYQSEESKQGLDAHFDKRRPSWSAL